MKYIDADKLLAEIERRLKIVEPHKDTFESAAACRQELIWMKDFINSLLQEQPEDKQLVIIPESHGVANIKWDCRSLSDVIILLRSAESFITEKQVEELRGTGSGSDYNTTEGRFRDAHKFQQEQPAMIQWTGNNLKEVIDFTGKSPRFGEWFKSWDEFESYVHSHDDILKLFSEDGSHYEVPVGAWIVKTPDGYNVPSVARFIHAKQEQPEVDLEKTVEFECIGKKVKMTIQELINYYIDRECVDVADECGF